MKLATLLWLQLVYAILGAAYNVVSLSLSLMGKPPLSATNPVIGLVFMTVYALALIPGRLRKVLVYRILMGVAIVGFGIFGIGVHIVNIFTHPELYQSILAWALAVGINVYGLVLNIIAVSGKYKS